MIPHNKVKPGLEFYWIPGPTEGTLSCIGSSGRQQAESLFTDHKYKVLRKVCDCDDEGVKAFDILDTNTGETLQKICVHSGFFDSFREFEPPRKCSHCRKIVTPDMLGLCPECGWLLKEENTGA